MTHGVMTLVLGSIIKVRHDNINNHDKDQVALALEHNLTNVKKCKGITFNTLTWIPTLGVGSFKFLDQCLGEPNLIQIGVF